MQFVVTAHGEAVLRATPGSPPVLGSFRLGNGASSYLPNQNQPDILGSVVYSGVPSTPVVQSANLIKYTILMDGLTANLTFSEVGLYLPDGSLFAIGVQTPAVIVPGEVNRPRSAALDCYISVDENEAFLFAELGNSASTLNAQSQGTVDQLPPAVNANPNLVVVPNPIDPSQSTIAVSNNSIWSFSTHTELAFSGMVSMCSGNWLRSDTPAVSPAFDGELILQFTSGKNLGICRIVSAYAAATNTYTFDAPLAQVSSVGDSFIVLRSTALRPTIAQLLNALSPLLTADMLNSLVQYPLSDFLKADGSTPMTGDLDVSNHRVINLSNPIQISDAANKGYADANGGGGSGGSINIEDYLSSTVPQAIAVYGNAGVAGLAARADHRHAHGNQPGGTLHDSATSASAGFMSAADKVKLDSVTQRFDQLIQTFQVIVPAVSWTINHGMGTVNLVAVVYNLSGQQELVPIQIIDDNSFSLLFAEPRAGRVVVFFDTNNAILVS